MFEARAAVVRPRDVLSTAGATAAAVDVAPAPAPAGRPGAFWRWLPLALVLTVVGWELWPCGPRPFRSCT